MTEEQIKELQAANDKLKKENEGLKKGKKALQDKLNKSQKEATETQVAIKEMETTIKQLEAATESKVIYIPGKLTVTWDMPNGQSTKKTVKFKNGRKNTYLRKGILVPSASLIAIAAGKDVSANELQTCPHLAQVTKELAIEEITHLAQIGAECLEEV